MSPRARGATGSRLSLIRTPDQRLRVFVSSSLQELAAERGVVRAAIEQLRLAPVMFEFVGIYWQHYGWVGPEMDIEVRDRFGGSGLRPWPWAAQAEQPTIEQAKALLPGGEYTAQLATGRSQTIDEALAAATPILQDPQQPAAAR